jgi:chemotaxis protein MotB
VKQRRSRGVTENGYFASITDLMIGLLFLFILMLMAFAVSYREAQARQESSARSKEHEAAQLKAINTLLTDSDFRRAVLLRDIRSELNRRNLPIQIDEKHGVVRLPEGLLFDSGSADFGPEGSASIEKIGAVLLRELGCRRGPGKKGGCRSPRAGLDSVFIEGHTDNVPISNAAFSDNWDLSLARAKTTYQALVARYPGLGELRNERAEPLFGLSGYGETRPIASDETDAGRARNRRIDIRFVMALPRSAGL